MSFANEILLLFILPNRCFCDTIIVIKNTYAKEPAMIILSAFSDERNHIRYMEIRSVDGTNVADLILEQAKEYQAILEQNGIAVWSIGSPIGKVKLDCDWDAYCQKVAHVCQLARIFKTDKIRMFSFFDAYDKSELVKERLGQMVAIAKTYGITLCHENEKDIYGDTLARVEEIAESAPELALIFDPANYVQCGQNTAHALDKLAHKTIYFHIKDVISATGELVPAGHGDGNIPKLISMIGREETKVLTIEPHLAVFDAYKSIDQTEMKHKFHFTTPCEAFDFAVSALKSCLIAAGYTETTTGDFVLL